ncbi:hypothetical protein MJG53_003491 [Ovis ammon polii x Ovis aries]|uniref:Uncharacterized protein n=1 Tax=Ovis ammon polii x Ovis aries TaxID=2918886 RepID=A0ACB9VGX7_9CETA|nr:hypothetical protein MJG53_003491 [Ovis ammon polii x Ovis aries]
MEALHRSAQPSLAVVHWLSCPTAFGVLVPLPGIESTGFITSGPPEKSQVRFNGPTFPDSTYSQSPKWRRSGEKFVEFLSYRQLRELGITDLEWPRALVYSDNHNFGVVVSQGVWEHIWNLFILLCPVARSNGKAGQTFVTVDFISIICLSILYTAGASSNISRSNYDKITLEEHWKFIFETSHLLFNGYNPCIGRKCSRSINAQTELQHLLGLKAGTLSRYASFQLIISINLT